VTATEQGTQQRWSFGWVVAGYVLGNIVAVVLVSLWVGLFGDRGIMAVLISSIALWVGFVGAPMVASRVEGTGDPIADFGVRFRWSDLPIGVVTGVGLQLVALPLLYAVIQFATGPLDIEGPARDLADKAGGPAGWAAFAIIVGVGAPIAEELFFRGLLRGAIQARAGRTVAVVLSSALFAATHFQVVQFAGLFLAGLTWALLADRAERLGPAIVSHTAFNLTTVAALLMSS
jgi:membrane protease YdiL (CAAX protease family)